MLGELMRLKNGIAIAGSHGKTTTTSLIATILQQAQLEPTVVIGGRLNAMGTGASHGAGELLVAEADESDGSFLRLAPVICVITNIDPEHLDHYGCHEKLKRAFAKFANRIPFYGKVVACLDHPDVQDILPKVEKRVTTYGLSAQADFQAERLTSEGLTTSFNVIRLDEDLGRFSIPMPGMHNVLNALAAIAVADEVGVSIDVMRHALAHFGGVHRRFTVVGEAHGVTVIDDYGHHPEEIKATLKAARDAYQRRVVIIFQPHRFSRTHHLFDALTRSFNHADVLFVTDVYAAGEAPIEGADTPALVNGIRRRGHHDVHHVPAALDLVQTVVQHIRPNDVVITLGAGDISKAAPRLLDALRVGALSLS